MIIEDKGFCIEDVSGPCPDYTRIKIIYPTELASEEILRKSIHNVNAVIGEYLTNLELSCRCEEEYSKLFFDSQKDEKKSEIKKYYDKMYELKAAMDKGIAPYEWKVRKTFRSRRLNSDYIVCLKKCENEDE